MNKMPSALQCNCESSVALLIKASQGRSSNEGSKCLKIRHSDDCDICIIKTERVSSAPYMM